MGVSMKITAAWLGGPLLAVVTPAYAVQPPSPPHVTIYLQSSNAAPSYVPTVSWDFGTNAKPNGQQVLTNPVVIGGSSFFPSKNGNLKLYPVGGKIGSFENVSPPGFKDNFLVIKGTAGSYTAKVSDLQVFSFKFAYLDAENGVSLTFANGTTTSFTAQDLLGGATVNGQSYRVSFDMGGGAAISKVVFYNNKSNQSGDEPQSEDGGNGTSLFFIDSITGAAPEPATWSMMILGFGLVGASLRSGRRSKLPAAT